MAVSEANFVSEADFICDFKEIKILRVCRTLSGGIATIDHVHSGLDAEGGKMGGRGEGEYSGEPKGKDGVCGLGGGGRIDGGKSLQP